MADEKFELTRRKALAGLGTIGAASAGAGLGTTAYLNDVETFSGNSVTAGELNLIVDYETSVDQDGADTDTSISSSGTVDGDEDYTYEYTIDDAKPGDSGQLVFCPKIVDNPGFLWVGSVDGITNDDNGLTEPEEDAGDTTGGDGEGELGSKMLVRTSYCSYDSDGNLVTERVMDDGISNGPGGYNMNDLAADLVAGFPVDGDFDGSNGTNVYPASSDASTQNGPCICIEWKIPGPETGNVIQTDSVALDFQFQATQERHNSNSNPFA